MSGKVNTAVVISDEHEDGNESDSHKKEVVKYLNTVREKHASKENTRKMLLIVLSIMKMGLRLLL